MLKKCIGIPSYFPEKLSHRIKRVERFTSLLKTIENIWPDIDILIIAQNWKEYQPPKLKNNLIVKRFSTPLTIIGARDVLRDEFLNLGYDYIIMLDDDAIISYEDPQICVDYLAEIDKHPDGFCFIHGHDSWHDCDDYVRAPLNLCAISRSIYEREAIPHVTLEKDEALEDDLFAVLLHFKYADKEFMPPAGIKCTHYIRNQYLLQNIRPNVIPSTWFDATHKTDFQKIIYNTQLAINYIKTNRNLNLQDLKNNSVWRS